MGARIGRSLCLPPGEKHGPRLRKRASKLRHMGDDGLFFNPLWTVFAERSVVPMAVGTATGCRAVLVGVSLLTTASAHWAPPTTVLLTVSKALAVEASHRVPDVRPYFQFKILNLQRTGRRGR